MIAPEELGVHNARVLAALIERVVPLFVPEVKITLLARLPGNNEADVLTTNDNLVEVRDAIERGIAREGSPG